MLQRKNLTTYAYIVQEAAKRRDKMRHDHEVAAHRSGAILKANHEGRTIDSMKLHAGRICRAAGCESCDPLEIPERLAKGASSDAEFGANFGNALSKSDSQPGLESPSLVGGSDSSAAAEEAFVPDPGVTFVKVKQQQNTEQLEAAASGSVPLQTQECQTNPEQPTAAPVS
jgi:hypothetical protein